MFKTLLCQKHVLFTKVICVSVELSVLRMFHILMVLREINESPSAKPFQSD